MNDSDAPEPATRPQPATPIPWRVSTQKWAGTTQPPPPPVLIVGPYPPDRTTEIVIAEMSEDARRQEQDAEYIVYAANELPKREARIERLEMALMLVTDGPASRRALSTKEARAVAEDELKEADDD